MIEGGQGHTPSYFCLSLPGWSMAGQAINNSAWCLWPKNN